MRGSRLGCWKQLGKEHSITVSSVIRCSKYKLRLYTGFNRPLERYNPTAPPFIPANRSLEPDALPLFEPTSPPSARPAATPAQKGRGQAIKKADEYTAQTAASSAAQQSHVDSSSSKTKTWVNRKASKHDDIAAVIPAIQCAVKVLKERDDTDPPPDPTNLLPSGLYFSSPTAAAAANLITYWDPPANDPSIPRTQAGVEAWIHRLVDAINNNVGCVKTNTEKDSQGWIIRWGDGAVFYRKTAIEAVAWKLYVSLW